MKSAWIKANLNPIGNRVRDCAQRAIAAALGVDWDTASDMIYGMAKGMATTTEDDAAWGAVLRRAGFYRAIIPNTCPDCYTMADFCRDHPQGVFVVKMSGHVATVINGKLIDTWNSLSEIPQYFWYLPQEA